MTHLYRWKKYLPSLYGQRCRVLARGSMNSVMVEFENGTRHIVSRFAIRRLRKHARMAPRGEAQ